jgi:hypothetical protein
MSHKIFMNFIEILKLLLIFEVLVKKTPINYKIYSKTFNFLLYSGPRLECGHCSSRGPTP